MHFSTPSIQEGWPIAGFDEAVGWWHRKHVQRQIVCICWKQVIKYECASANAGAQKLSKPIKSTTTRWSQLMMERLELNTSPLCLSEQLIIIFFGWREDLCSFVDHCARTKTQSCSQILKEKQQLMHTKGISLTSATWTGKNQEVPPQKLLKICSQLVPYGNKKQVYRC